MAKKTHFRGCFGKQYRKRAQALVKPASEQLYHIHRSLVRKFCSKKYLLVTCQILGLLVNTLATDQKYPIVNRETFTIPIQMQLPQKQKTFSDIFPAFLKSRLNFKIFE